MTKFDLFDSIGNVDDELIEKAIEPKKSSKKAFLAITSVAACAVFACAAVLIVQNMNKTNNVAVDSGASSAIGTSSVKPVNEDSSDNGAVGGSSSETSVLVDGSDEIKNESSETIYEQIPVEMYKIKDGKLVHSKLVLDADPQKIFVVWKSENDIGEEVKLVDVRLDDNGTDTVSEYSGVEVATHTKGDHTILTITVTNNLEDYYEIEDYYCYRSQELVLESLKKTMLSMCEPKPDEYQLILSDNTEDERTESISSVSDDKQSNNDVVNSDTYPVTETSPTNPETREFSEQKVTSGVSQEYTPDESETDEASSNYAEESESNYVAPEDIQYNDQGEALE